MRVRLLHETLFIDIKYKSSQIAIIEDEETAKSQLPPAISNEPSEQEQISWWWLLIIAMLGVTGKAIYERYKERTAPKK